MEGRRKPPPRLGLVWASRMVNPALDLQYVPASVEKAYRTVSL